MMANNKISQIIDKIQTAARPPKFTQEILKNIGFTSTNDRAVIPLFKKLGFLNDDGIPTQYYDQLRDKTTSRFIMASRIRDLYSELFAINTSIFNDDEANVKGAISRVTGKDDTGVTRILNTFRALCNVADFTSSVPVKETTIQEINEIQSIEPPIHVPHIKTPTFHYNIQIHLPATTDISVYNAIFKSLKENLIV
jgi:hypothetical protein